MQDLAQLEDRGWLRARGTASTTAHYSIRVCRRVSGPRIGEIVATGTLRADLGIVLDAVAAGRAVLILAGGEAVAIEITQAGTSVSTFRVTGPLPGFTHLA